METYQSIFVGLQTILGDPLSILYLVLGTFGGMIFGAIPGLTGALGVTLMLPFTFSMSASRGWQCSSASMSAAFPGDWWPR